MATFGQYKKTAAAVIIGVIGWVTAVVESGDEAITSTEWIALATIVITALGVYAWRNDPPVPALAEPPTITPPGGH